MEVYVGGDKTASGSFFLRNRMSVSTLNFQEIFKTAVLKSHKVIIHDE